MARKRAASRLEVALELAQMLTHKTQEELCYRSGKVVSAVYRAPGAANGKIGQRQGGEQALFQLALYRQTRQYGNAQMYHYPLFDGFIGAQLDTVRKPHFLIHGKLLKGAANPRTRLTH